MGKIKKILENELVGGTRTTDVYPVTSIKAVYDEDNERLDNIINRRGIVNISTNYNRDHIAEVLTLSQAIAKVPSKDRVLGFQGKFLTSEGWKSYMFTGDSLSNWTDATKWIEQITSVAQEAVTKEINNLNSNTGVSEYEEFSEEKSYIIGDIVIKDGYLKEFTADHPIGVWIGTDTKDVSLKKINDTKFSELEVIVNGEKKASQTLPSTSVASNNNLLPIDIKKGDIFYIKFNTTNNASVNRFVLTYNGIWSNRLIDANNNVSAGSVSENINKWLEFTAKENINILGYSLYNTTQIDTAAILSVKIKSISSRLDNIDNDLLKINDDVEGLIKEVGGQYVVTPIENKGLYINNAGNVGENSGYIYTEPINIKKGNTIILNAAGYKSYVSMISKKTEDGYIPLVVSSGNVKKEYKYTVTEDCEIVLSYSLNEGHNIVVDVQYLSDRISALEGKTDNPTEYKGNLIGLFKLILCIGDSTTSGIVNWAKPSAGQGTMTDYSYPSQLTKMCGVETFNYGQSSATCKSWYIDHYENTNMGKVSQGQEGTVKFDAVIIQLGINDWYKLVQDLGREPQSEEECATQIAEAKEYLQLLITYTKNCSKGCKIFLATITSAYTSVISPFFISAFSRIIYELADENSNVFVVDLSKYGKLGENHVNTYGHPTAIGYMRTAEQYINYISYIIETEEYKFKDVQFIRTEYSY